MSGTNQEIPPVTLSRDDIDLIVELACSLDEKPGSNWVEKAGGLPNYICEIARAIKRSGKPTGTAIAIAVSRAKKWCSGAGGNTNADTKAKACAAVAQWEKKKASSKAKTAAKKVKASHVLHDHLFVALTDASDAEYIAKLRTAWESAQAKAYEDYLKENAEGPTEAFVREIWPDHIVVSSSYDNEMMYEVTYTDKDGNFAFGEIKGIIDPLVQLDDNNISDTELLAAMELSRGSCTQLSESMDKFVRLAATKEKSSGAKKPYGDVKYADPGYKNNQKRYPIDTAAHVRAAWSYINMPKNHTGYTSEEVAAIKAKIKAAAKKFNIEISDSRD